MTDPTSVAPGLDHYKRISKNKYSYISAVKAKSRMILYPLFRDPPNIRSSRVAIVTYFFPPFSGSLEENMKEQELGVCLL